MRSPPNLVAAANGVPFINEINLSLIVSDAQTIFNEWLLWKNCVLPLVHPPQSSTRLLKWESHIISDCFLSLPKLRFGQEKLILGSPVLRAVVEIECRNRLLSVMVGLLSVRVRPWSRWARRFSVAAGITCNDLVIKFTVDLALGFIMVCTPLPYLPAGLSLWQHGAACCSPLSLQPFLSGPSPF